MNVLVTGAAGFIGSSTAAALMKRGDRVVGIDNINDYYDVSLKHARLKRLSDEFGSAFDFRKIDFSDAAALRSELGSLNFDRIIHLGAQAGVRYSIENPGAYVQSVLVSLWGQHQPAVPSRRSRRPSAFALCRDQESGRADHRILCQPVSPAGNWPAFLHRLWSVGPAGHGDVDLPQSADGRPRAAGV